MSTENMLSTLEEGKLEKNSRNMFFKNSHEESIPLLDLSLEDTI
jgi:hypothetical protein